MALTSTGQDVVSNPSTSTGGGANLPADIFQPSTPTPNGGGGSLPGGMPTCFKIDRTSDIADDQENVIVYIQLKRKYFDKLAKNGLGAWKYASVTFSSGQLILTHSDGDSSVYNFNTGSRDRNDDVLEAPYIVPADIYAQVVNKPSAVNGFFTSPIYEDDSGISFENQQLSYCK